MKRSNVKGEVFQQIPVCIHENADFLTKEANIPISKAVEQGVIAALRARSVEV